MTIIKSNINQVEEQGETLLSIVHREVMQQVGNKN